MGSVQPEPDTEAGSMATRPRPCTFIEEGPLFASFMNGMFNLVTVLWNKCYFHFTDRDRVFAVGFSNHDPFVTVSN